MTVRIRALRKFGPAAAALFAVALAAPAALAQARLAEPDAEQPIVEGEVFDGLLDEDYLGVRIGLLVTFMNGQEIVAIRPDERFLPASNTKLFTVAAAFRWLDELQAMAPELATTVRLEPRAGEDAPPDIALIGRGAPELEAGADCEEICLSGLADAVAAAGVTRVGDVIGDDSWFPDERWRGGWSWDDLGKQSGTAVSAIVINDNLLRMEIAPGAAEGDPIRAAWLEGDDLYEIDVSDTLTVSGAGRLWIENTPGAGVVRLHGTLPRTGRRAVLSVGVYDPAEAAARRLARLLEARGIAVEGSARARHRPLTADDEDGFGALFRSRAGVPGSLEPPAEGPEPTMAGEEDREIARTPPPDLLEMLETTSKDSQNLYAGLVLRQLGHISGRGSAADGLVKVYELADEAGIPITAMDLNDGSGMSVYNRFSPRAAVLLLRHAAGEPWGQDFRETLPVGGVDGTLSGRFRGTALQGRVFAKTGTLQGVNALSGYMLAESGNLLAFSAMANDRPITANSANAALDRALARIAAEN